MHIYISANELYPMQRLDTLGLQNPYTSIRSECYVQSTFSLLRRLHRSSPFDPPPPPPPPLVLAVVLRLQQKAFDT